MSRRTVIILIVVVIVVGFLVFRKIQSKHSGTEKLQQRGSDQLIAQVLVVRDTVIAFPLQALGTLMANEEVNIVSEYAGKITDIGFKEGATISRGALLFKLDDSELKAQKQKLEAEEKLASDNEVRYKVLQSKGGVSQQEYEETLNKLQTTRADLALVNVQLDKTNIRAPFSGKIGLRNVSEGSYVSANTVLTNLQDLSNVKIDFSLPEKYAGWVRAGQTITFTIESDTQRYSASILATDPGVDPVTRTIKVRAITNNTNQRLVSGSSAKIDFTLGDNRKTIMVPTSALIPKGAEYLVYIVKDGKATMRTLKTGIRTEENVEVIDGLLPGDSLIITNILMLRPDVKVKVQ